MKNKNTFWLNTLFDSYIQNTNTRLYFEKKVELKSPHSILNLSIHPLRFGDDIFFNFETNDDALRIKLKKYEVNYDIFYHYADITKATYLQSIKNDKYHSDSLLLIGQTERDKVIFDGYKHLSLLDYMEDIKKLSLDYQYIYFKPHPYAKNNKHIYKMLKKEFDNITIVHDNIYHLLSSNNIKTVAGLNSSVLYEAKYFRKDVQFLYKPYFDMGGKDIGIYGNYFDSAFWADIFDIKDTNISLPFMSNRLRKSINDFWGYNEISDEIILRDIIKNKIKYFVSKYIR